MIAVPATLIGWHFTTAFNRHTEREKAKERARRPLSRNRVPTSQSFATTTGIAGTAGLLNQKFLIKEAVEEATSEFKREIRELRELILRQNK